MHSQFLSTWFKDRSPKDFAFTGIRSLLVVVSTILALHLGTLEISEIDKKTSEYAQQLNLHWHEFTIAILIIATILIRWLWGTLHYFYDWLARQNFAALFFATAIFGSFFVHRHHPIASFAMIAILSLLGATSIWLFWPAKTHQETTSDTLHRTYFVDRIAEFFAKQPQGFRRVAIFGTWGTGKTTVLKLLKEKLSLPKNGGYSSAIVNPWQAATPEEAWAILANGFDRALGFPSRIPRGWAKGLSGLKTLFPLPGIGEDLIKFFAGEEGQTGKQRLQKINELLKRKRAKVLVLVDDMERAEPAVIRKIFPIIDRLSELKNCFFIFAIDRERISQAFSDKTRDDETKGYLDKVFDLQLELPLCSPKDIAAMMRPTISVAVTPKLAASFPRLEPLLPRNPRAALRFLNDAKAKEVLFLSRYRANEYAYTPFFVLRILECEYPGISATLLDDKALPLFTQLTAMRLFVSQQDERRDKEVFEKLLTIIKGALQLDESDLSRVELLLRAIVRDLSPTLDFRNLSPSFDIRWGIDTHMRLISLSIEERELVENVWLQSAGTMSIENMLLSALHRKVFSEPETCARQLILLQSNKVSNELSAAFSSRDKNNTAASIENAAKTTALLSKQLHFCLDQNIAFDKAAFDSDLFKEWVDSLERFSLETIQTKEAAKLSEERVKFAMDLTELFSAGRCYSEISFGVIDQLLRIPREGRHSGVRSQINALRGIMMEKISSEIANLFRVGAIPSQWPPPEFPERTSVEFFIDPANWLPSKGGVIDLGPLSSLVDDAESSSGLADSFASLTYSLFIHPHACNACAGNHPNQRRQFEELARSNPEYLRLFWRAATSPKVSVDWRERILTERVRAESGVDGKPFVKPEVLNDIFPTGSSSPTTPSTPPSASAQTTSDSPSFPKPNPNLPQ